MLVIEYIGMLITLCDMLNAVHVTVIIRVLFTVASKDRLFH